MKRKSIALFLALALAVVSLTGCGKGAASNTNLLQSIKDRGYITVGTEGTWSPYTYHNEQDEIAVYELDNGFMIEDTPYYYDQMVGAL